MVKVYRMPTWTSLVEEVLRQTDDFMNRQMLLVRVSGMTGNQLDAALYHLRKYRVVDVIIQPDGEGWWFALPPDLDTRMRHVLERKPEVRRRKIRKAKAK